ncbi:FCD domain-containing protein [Kineococcus sp. R8]|uniref:GntR family transcriptional regulator n=1 Tax=Kineococcus siccus TaxID=2696567 RepID=UPI001412A19A|nr:GntR family transcriptional regulator [Kineococcus siccus]NAZ83343.1 FCD domain-containing protein [Kineococcus siccus]
MAVVERGARRPAATRQLLADHVYDAVLDLLIDGEYQAGTTLGIDALAREFEVSQTPVREALARLEATGLVRRTALKGYRVAPVVTPGELERLMQARLVLECANAELAALAMDDEILQRLEDAVHDLAVAPLGPSFHEFRQYWAADERFHLVIAEATGNEFLQSAYAALGGTIQRFRLFGGRGVTDSDHCVAEHTKVLDALRTGDPVRARAGMAAHITEARDRALAAYDLTGSPVEPTGA